MFLFFILCFVFAFIGQLIREPVHVVIHTLCSAAMVKSSFRDLMPILLWDLLKCVCGSGSVAQEKRVVVLREALARKRKVDAQATTRNVSMQHQNLGLS